MGYLTNYCGHVISGGDEKEIAIAISNLDYFKDDHIGDISTINDVISSDQMKWYDWQEDITKISLLFPEATICIMGEGEDRDDNWHAYFKNGKCVVYQATIVYPEFDPKDLEN